MALETTGYLVPYSRGTLSPMALLSSSAFYLVVMAALPVLVICNNGWDWTWFLTPSGGATVAFVATNAILVAASYAVCRRLWDCVGDDVEGDDSCAGVEKA